MVLYMRSENYFKVQSQSDKVITFYNVISHTATSPLPWTQFDDEVVGKIREKELIFTES